MGAAMKYVTTTQRHQYTVLAPAAHVEILKALNWASRDFLAVKGRPVEYDDDIWIIGDEERITVYFDAEAAPANCDSCHPADSPGAT
jgi:hypothetical protein